MLIFALVLAWTLASGAVDATGSASIYRNISLVRLAILGAILAVLAIRQDQSQHFLRGIEYSLFAALTLLWAACAL